MGRWTDGIHAFGHHAGAGHIAHDFGTSQMSADPGLCALTDLDFDGRASHQVFPVHAKPAGGNLHNGICPIRIQIPVQTALTGIVIGAQCLCSPTEGRVHIVADGTVAHGCKQNGSF